MPLAQIDLPRALFEEKATAIGLELQAAFVEAAGVPPADKFQIFRPREAGELVFDPSYGGVDRQNLVVVQILMVHHHPVDQKRALYRAIVERFVKLGIRKEDILIAVTENGFEDWYGGKLYGE